MLAKGQGLVLTDHARSGYVKLSVLGGDIRAKELERRFGESFAAYHSRAAERPERSSRPLVSEIDILLALHKLGVVDSADVQKAMRDRDREVFGR